MATPAALARLDQIHDGFAEAMTLESSMWAKNSKKLIPLKPKTPTLCERVY